MINKRWWKRKGKRYNIEVVLMASFCYVVSVSLLSIYSEFFSGWEFSIRKLGIDIAWFVLALSISNLLLLLGAMGEKYLNLVDPKKYRSMVFKVIRVLSIFLLALAPVYIGIAVIVGINS